MIIVSDTSSISNLIQIEQLHLLNALYGEITITPAVKRELYRIESHIQVIENLDWIKVISPVNQQMVLRLLNDLDLGESEAIALAIEQNAEYLIIDEYLGREIAQKFNIKVIGVLGVLLSAKEKGLLTEVKPHIDKLQQIGFWLNQNLLKLVLTKAGEI